jgi:hypothetical protein
MYEELSINRMIKDLKEDMRDFHDQRVGKNKQYQMEDAGMAAFSVFFTQCASFLEHQRTIKRKKGKSNLERLFMLKDIPSDNQIRNLLDPVDPEQIEASYQRIFLSLEKTNLFDKFRSFDGRILIAMDGTDYYSSTKIYCKKCSQRTLKNGEINYHHSVITPVIVQAENERVISLEPEFIVPQDGQEKQDCEINASKRWLEKHGSFYAKRRAIILGDDLYSHQPYCQKLIDKGFHFILVCKPDSHDMLYKTINFLAANDVLNTKTVRQWNGKYGEIYTYRYSNKVPLRGDKAALDVNWCEVTIVREDTGKQLYRNSFITSFTLSDTNVETIVRDGRARWKIENENNNVLKQRGYHLEHNFGHGSNYLSSLLLSLNILAFLFHTILDMVDERYRAIRAELVKRTTFFKDLEALLRYFSFDSWDQVLSFMFTQLEINSS